MINFIRRLFGLPTPEQKQQQPTRVREYIQDHDMIDYDGMGNQGRFPTHK